jgi:hypothetical protein
LNCNIDFVVLGGNSSSGPGITYQWSSIEGTIASDPTGSKITVTAGGVYDLEVSDSNNGCVSFDQATVTVDTIHPSGVINVAEILDCDTGGELLVPAKVEFICIKMYCFPFFEMNYILSSFIKSS